MSARLKVHTGPAISRHAISLATTTNLTGWSERTVWRRLASGSLARAVVAGEGRAMLGYDSIAPHVCIVLDEQALAILFEADAGLPDAQTDMALLLMAAGKHGSAVYWLESAARAGHADGMHWLGRCHLTGDGVRANRNLGLMWLAKSAAAGHVISEAFIAAICEPFVGSSPAGLGCDRSGSGT